MDVRTCGAGEVVRAIQERLVLAATGQQRRAGGNVETDRIPGLPRLHRRCGGRSHSRGTRNRSGALRSWSADSIDADLSDRALARRRERLQLAAQAAPPADDEDMRAEFGAAVVPRFDEQRAVGVVGRDDPSGLQDASQRRRARRVEIRQAADGAVDQRVGDACRPVLALRLVAALAPEPRARHWKIV